MGNHAKSIRKDVRRRLRNPPPTDGEKQAWLDKAHYEGSPYHKRNPGDFGLTPPMVPRPDKTLCDTVGITSRKVATSLLQEGIRRGLVSDAVTPDGFPKEIWAVDENGHVLEAMYGGSTEGGYHGYPLKEGDPFSGVILDAWDGMQ